MACRDSKKAEKAAKEIIKLTNNKNVDVEFLDLSDLSTVRCFAGKMNKNLKFTVYIKTPCLGSKQLFWSRKLSLLVSTVHFRIFKKI